MHFLKVCIIEKVLFEFFKWDYQVVHHPEIPDLVYELKPDFLHNTQH